MILNLVLKWLNNQKFHDFSKNCLELCGKLVMSWLTDEHA